jgi:hypothetical protein
MSKISDYLSAGREDKIYDPNKGLYVNPQTGEVFVPTFTNNPQSDLAQRMGQTMERQGQPVDMSQGAYLIRDRQPTGMPGRGQQPQGQPKVNPEDPWEVANYYMSSDKFKNEIYQKMFPGRDPSQGFQNEKERSQYYKALQSTRNMLVDNVKWKLEYGRKKKADQQKGAARGVSQQQLMKMIQDEKLRLDEVNNQATTMPENKVENTMEQAKKNVMELLQATGGIMGVDRGEGGGMPVQRGQRGQRVQGPGTPEAKGAEGQASMGGGGNQVAQQLNVYGADTKTKRLGELTTKQATKAAATLSAILKSMYPDKSIDELNKMHRSIFEARMIPEEWYTLDPKQIIERAQKRTAGGVKEAAQTATDSYYQGGSPAII